MNKLQKVLALVLCAAVCLCGGGMAAVRSATDSTAAKAAPAAAHSAEGETVYVMTAADGAAEKIYLGGEAMPGGGEDDLPVALRVSYTLDGKAVSAEKLAGQSGHVTIRFDYEALAQESVALGGRRERVDVPFAVLTGLMLDNDRFSSVTVTNGRAVDDGERTIVVGLALPGLGETLALDADTLEIPDYVQIEADVENFALGMTVTLATSEPFCELDETKLDAADDAADSLDGLTEAMDALMEGADALYDGLCTLLGSAGELSDGVSQLAAGASELKSGALSLKSGAASAKSGAGELSSGLSTLSASSATLNSGAAQVFASLLSTANTQLANAGLSVSTLTVGNYASVLGALIDSLDETAVYNAAYAQVSAAVEAQRGTIEEAVTAAVRESVSTQVRAAVEASVQSEVTAAVQAQVTAQVLESLGMTQEMYEAADDETRAAVDAAVEEQLATDAVRSQITAAADAQMQSDEVQTLIAQNIEGQMASDAVQATIAQNVEAQVAQAIADAMASDEVQGKLAAASEGAQSVIALKTSLDSYNAFYLGLAAYTAGVDQAASGAAELVSGLGALSDGAGELAAGASELQGGAAELNDAMPALTQGVTDLRDGAEQLRDGLEELNEQVVEKLVQLVEDDLAGLTDRVRAAIDASCAYEGLGGKYIYRTGEIAGD